MRVRWFSLVLLLACGCKAKGPVEEAPQVTYFHVDPATAGDVSGVVTFAGAKPVPKLIDMSGDPACVQAHQGKAYDESVMVGPGRGLGNVFVYVSKGLEGKAFEAPKDPVTIDQRGCWFHPHVLGVRVGQPVEIVNSDPVTHNIHPMAVVNREWNHSQGPGEPPVMRHFLKPEVMIPVKCNIHGWMHAYIGVVDHPYFAVTKENGSYDLPKLPPGVYTVTFWHEKLGVKSETVTVGASGKVSLGMVFGSK